MMRSTKELRHVYRDFLLEANQSYSDIVVLEADLSSSMATNNLDLKGLKYIRTIRKAPVPVYQGGEDFSKGYIELRHGEDLVIVASGIMVAPSIRVADELSKLGYSVGVIDLFRIKPIPEQIKTMLSGKTIFTVENHNQIGGIGSALCELFSDDGITKIHRMGVQERFGQVGKMDYLLNEYGLSESNIKEKVLEIYNAR